MYLYQYCGDTQVLADHYDALKRYVDYLTRRRPRTHIVDIGLSDWAPAKTVTPVDSHLNRLLLRRRADRCLDGRLAGQRRRRAQVRRTGRQHPAGVQREVLPARQPASTANGSQTALSCALYQGLAEPENKARVLSNWWRTSSGRTAISTRASSARNTSCTPCIDNGRADVAYRIATPDKTAELGQLDRAGRHHLWEQWGDGDSRNHIMFGDISAWFYQALAGINPDPDSPGLQALHHPAAAGGRPALGPARARVDLTGRLPWRGSARASNSLST